MFRKLRLLLFLLLAASYSGYAQVPVVNITATPITGCAPLTVSFTGAASNSPITWSWNFGSVPPNVSKATSPFQNDVVTFNNAGTYIVTLVATNASGSSTPVNVTITVNPVPLADFNVNKSSGCFPTTINFTNVSSADVTKWIWDFGDGNIDSTTYSPNHIYHFAGSYPVTLAVQNGFGCKGKASVKNVAQAITLTNPGVIPDFVPNINSSCTLPVTVNFLNQTMGPPTMSYSWDFGDGSGWSSTFSSPTFPYTAAGAYTVKLAATSSAGCTDTLTSVVNISASGNVTDFTGSGNVCLNTSVNFTNISAPAPSSATWDYGDGNTGNSINGQHTYLAPGTYPVTLVNTFGGCTGTITKNVTVVGPPVANFTGTNINACAPPLISQFNDLTPGATSWSWDFGDGGVSTLKSPQHTYNTYGSFNVTLIASSAGGCSSTLTKTSFVNIAKPTVVITNAPANGCAPFVYTPTISVTAPDGVASYSWNFGNGFTFIGASPPPQTYGPGTYTVTLTITTNGGCTSLPAIGTVKVGSIQPATNFSAVPTTACVKQFIQFTDMSPGSDQWFWDFGDGSTNGISSTPVYAYTKPGVYDVSLTAYNNGCFKKVTKLAYITINPPLADFTYSFACGSKSNYTFLDNSMGAITWNWDFGDLTPHSFVKNPPLHIYPAGTASYNVTLIVTGAGGCADTITKKIDVNQSTTITSNANPVCNNTLVSFSTSGPPPSNFLNYSFDFGDGSPLQGSGSGSTSHTYATPGNYLVTVTTTDLNSCVETSAPYTMRISGPTVKFTTPTQISCSAFSATFTDQSTPSPGSSLVAWAWDFGDGGTATGQTPPAHNYSQQGIFPVKLKVTDNNGCSDSLTNPSYITVSLPVAKFSTPSTNYCPASNVKFYNTSTGGFGSIFTWDFKDGNTFIGPNPPLHNFPLVNTYPVSVSMTDIYNCTSTFTMPVPIKIDTPNATFNMSANTSSCPPLTVNFTFAGHYDSLTSWNFDNGATANNTLTPSTIYVFPGDYFPKLIVTSPGGCLATFTDHVHIDGPIGAFTYSPLSACDSLDVIFNVVTANSVSFTWNFNDGITKITAAPTTTHKYVVPGAYIPFVTLVDAAGCNVNYIGTNPIEIDHITKTDFIKDKSQLCDNGVVNFTNTSLVTTGTTITDYKWDFNDGSPTQNGLLPAISHPYTTVGNYNPSLTITTLGGCSGTFSMPVSVYASPQIDISGIVWQCEPATLNFSGFEIVPDPNGPLTWNWDFGNGQTGVGQNQPGIPYPKAGQYLVELIATNNKGCSDTTDISSGPNLFIYPIPTVNAGPDVTICDTSSLQLNATGDATSYTWDPPVIGNLSTLIGPSPIATSPASTYFVVHGMTLYGCQAKDTINVTVNTQVTVTASGTDSVCLGQSTPLTASGAAIYNWAPSQGLDNPNIANPIATPDVSQIGAGASNVITYTVTGYDNKKCYSDTKSIDVTAFKYPAIGLVPNATINVGSSYQINATATTNIVSLNWTPPNNLSCINCLTPVANPIKTTKYNLTAINDGGCATTDSIRLQVICNGANFFVPNTFSPNGDGVNDYFIVNGVGLNVIPSITIYNRWGQIVFQKNNFAPNSSSSAWDGNFNGQPAPQDVYIYTIQILCDNATLIPYHGNVTLIR